MPFTALAERVRSEDPAALAELLIGMATRFAGKSGSHLLDARVRQLVSDSDVYQSVVYRFYAGMKDGGFVVESPDDLLAPLRGIARTRIAELVRFGTPRNAI
ncbi:MAG: hypothetical protein R3C19_06600 [Planctomycetaceae bacterium]